MIIPQIVSHFKKKTNIVINSYLKFNFLIVLGHFILLIKYNILSIDYICIYSILTHIIIQSVFLKIE